MPGPSELILEVWDYDTLFSDDLIGRTVIDIEDRYYDSKWLNLEHKPIEVRPLYHPDLNKAQGYVSMFVEVFKNGDKAAIKKYNIEEPPINKFQLRLIVWKTEGIPDGDVEGTNDMYVTAFIDPKVKQSTDVHFRCQGGK